MKNRKYTTLSIVLLVSLLMIVVGMVSAHDPELPEPTPAPDGSGGAAIDFTPTYYEHIQPIMEANCVSCHIPGEFGYDSFAMDTAEGIIASAEDIVLITTTGYMPPWPPGKQSPHFMYERTLTDEEIALLVTWMEAGAPTGDPAKAVSAEVITSVPPVEADLTLQIPEPYAPNAESSDDYRCFILEPGFTEDTFITGYDIIPDNTLTVHHTLLFPASADQRAEAQSLDGADGKPGWTCYGATGLSSGGADNRGMLERFSPMLTQFGGISGLTALLSADDAAAQIETAAESDSELAALVNQFGGAESAVTLMNQLLGGNTDDLVAQAGGNSVLSTIGGWVPGNVPTHFPEGTGFMMPADSFIIMQMHYNTEANSDPDQTSVVLETTTDPKTTPLAKIGVFAPVEIPCPADLDSEDCLREVSMAQGDGLSDSLLAVCGHTLDDYADQTADNATTDCDFVATTSGWGVSVTTHQHELGKSNRMTLNPDTPDEQILLDIPSWDFAWQGSYWFAKPVWVNKGDIIRVTCSWDNSVSRNNPEPRYVVWGEGTGDEMCLASLTLLPAEEGDPPPVQYGAETETVLTAAPSEMAHDSSDMGMAHHHDEPLMLGASDTIPEVFLSVQPDPLGGYTVRVQTFNFIFAPQNAGGEHRDGEGHAHLYVNGEKVARLYGEWFHLDELPAGNNEITVTLNSNTHAALHANGEAIAQTVTIEVQ